MNRDKALEAARSLVAALEEEMAPTYLPDPEITLDEALRRLRAVLPTKHLKLELLVWDHPLTPRKVNIQWNVWDGFVHHTGPTLRDAVVACENTNKKPTLSDAQQTLNLSQEPPF
jgi:hypothetical protein